jgi:hypothetical protein
MAAGAALPGLFFCFAACVLLIFASVSPPTWNAVYFLNAGTGAGSTRFGVFGYTGSKTSVGYYFPAPFNGYKSVASPPFYPSHSRFFFARANMGSSAMEGFRLAPFTT